jgi:hypothetical protein
LLFAEGRTVIDVARQSGHSPTMALSTYSYLIDELEDAENRSAKEVIREARSAVFPQSSSARRGGCRPDSPRSQTCCKSQEAL